MPSNQSKTKPLHNWSFDAIGTAWWIGVYHVPTGFDPDRLYRQIRERIEAFDWAYSRFRGDSLVSRWAREAGMYDMPPDLLPLLKFYRQLYDLTDGSVTPLIGQVLSDAGYDARYSLRQQRELSSPPAWVEVLEYDARHLTLKRPALLDFGAAGKGYLVDIISRLLDTEGVDRFCVDAGGDIRYRGAQPFTVGLEHPDDSKLAVGVAELRGNRFTAICGSAGNRRAWESYNHIMDPRSLQSPRHLKAVWVVADSAVLADGLTTAFYFADYEKLRKHFKFEYAAITADLQLVASTGFPAEFY